MKFTLRQLSVFEAVTRLRTVSEAAQEVALSQSAASLALQELEAILGVTLFRRAGRRLSLNENGRRLLPQAKNLLQIAHEISDNGQGLSGVVRIAATGIIGGYIIPALCSRFLAAHPGVQIKLHTMAEPEVITGVENLEFDIGFIEGPTMRHMLLVEPWLDDDLVILAGPDHWAAGKRVPIQRLANEHWFLHPVGSVARLDFIQASSKIIKAGAITFETNDTEAIKRAVAAGQGITCLPMAVVAGEVGRDELAIVRAAGFPLRRNLNVISRKDIYRGVAASQFLQWSAAGKREKP